MLRSERKAGESVYVRERECVGASRWSWDETVRLTGCGKNVVGAVGDDELEAGNVGFWSRKTSPAPSQSDEVRIGVWMCVNSFSCA